MTKAERAARILQRIRKTGSARLPLSIGQKRANGRIIQKRTANRRIFFHRGMMVWAGFRSREMYTALSAGPNAPMTQMSIIYAGVLSGMTRGMLQMIQEQAKAIRKKAMIGCFLMVSL